MRMGFGLMAAVLALTVSGAALATPVEFDLGPGSYIDTTATSSALEMWASVYPSVESELFSLNEGESYSFLFARIGTNETWINDDDLVPASVVAHIDVTSPSLFPSVGGESIGFAGALHFTQGWNVTWNGPVVVDLGNGGEVTIELSDAAFSSGFWLGPDGKHGNAYADVYATFTLTRAPDEVIPEPATVALLGMGIAGLAARRMTRAAKA